MIQVSVFTDGENRSILQDKIEQAAIDEWNSCYALILGEITFLPAVNMKIASNINVLGKDIQYLMNIRNPDLLYVLKSTSQIIGGIEITDHSPDGSNADKRYPFLWASKRVKAHGFIVCPHSKQRPIKSGRTTPQINRFPFRHASRNIRLLSNLRDDPFKAIQQILPVQELQANDVVLGGNLEALLPSVTILGRYFAHITAAIIDPAMKEIGKKALYNIINTLLSFSKECIRNTTRVDPSSLYIDKERRRWVFLYNSRPDSGHWERGEGQFDSIDGRIMFALDEIEFLAPNDKPQKIELWMPQISSQHPWILEQISNEYGSKRFRNIMVILAKDIEVKFSDNLTENDWYILEKNQSLTLERADWDLGIFNLHDYYDLDQAEIVATFGEYSLSKALTKATTAFLATPNIFYATYRAYTPHWRDLFIAAISTIDFKGVSVLLPRIPKAMLCNIPPTHAKIIPAEECTKAQLIALRQVYKYKKAVGK